MKTLIYVDCLERANFFIRFAQALEGDVVFVTHRLSVYLMLPRKKVLLRYEIDDTVELDESLFYSTFCVIGKYHTAQEAKKITQSIMTLLNNLHSKEHFTHSLIFNGSTTIAAAISLFSRQNQIQTRFFELANLPHKLFWDRQGVNAASALFDHPEILDSLVVSEEEWGAYKQYYEEYFFAPPQIAHKKTIQWRAWLDYVGYFYKNALFEDRRNPFRILFQKIRNKRSIQYATVNLDCEYIFVPLQVSNDTQILLHSDYDNHDAMRFAKKQYPNQKIFAKIHPAEADLDFIQATQTLAKALEITLVENETKKVLAHAKKVIVINSTVGLEALILGKDVVILGRAIYANFSQERLKKYICGYLASIDYFGQGIIDFHEVRRIFA